MNANAPNSKPACNHSQSDTEARENIRLWLARLRDCTAGNLLTTRRTFVYAGIGDFLLQHGTWYENVRVDNRNGVMRACFRNAAMEAASHRGWKYVEGYSANELIEMHHSWCVDEKNNPVEVTWPTPGLAYFGVELPISRVLECKGSVLDPIVRNYRIYEEPWQGKMSLYHRRHKSTREEKLNWLRQNQQLWKPKVDYTNLKRRMVRDGLVSSNTALADINIDKLIKVLSDAESETGNSAA